MRRWQGMRDWSADLLEKRTGRNVEAWNRLIARRAFAKESALRKWLTAEGVTGYAQMLLVWERFGYPDFLTAAAPDPIGRPHREPPKPRPNPAAPPSAPPRIAPGALAPPRKTSRSSGS